MLSSIFNYFRIGGERNYQIRLGLSYLPYHCINQFDFKWPTEITQRPSNEVRLSKH